MSAPHELFYEGKPCKKHNHQNANGFNLRLRASGGCVECIRLRNEEFRVANKERAAERYAKQREALRENELLKAQIAELQQLLQGE